MSLDLDRPRAARSSPATAEDDCPSDVGQALRAALIQGATRIHLELAQEGARLRSRIRGRLRDVAFLPEHAGRSLSALLEEAAKGGVGILSLDDTLTLRYRLASCRTATGKAMVLTLLPPPDDPAVEKLEGLDVPEEIAAAIGADLAGSKGLILVAGTPGSGRLRTLRALADESEHEGKSLLQITYDSMSSAQTGHHPVMSLDPHEEIWTLLHRVESMDTDWLFLPEIRTPLHAFLAMLLCGAGRLVLAPIRARDAAGALVELLALGSDRHPSARDLTSVIAQHRLPRPCPHCSILRGLAPSDVPEAGWDPASRRQLLARSPKARNRGAGCKQCRGCGYIAWTYLYEYLPVTGKVADRLRSTTDPGRLHEELRTLTLGNGLLESAWREVLRGTMEPEGIAGIPGPAGLPFRLPRSCLDQQPLAPEEPEEVLEEEGTAQVDCAAGALAVEHEFFVQGYETLRLAIAKMETDGFLEPAALESLAEETVTALERDQLLVQAALSRGPGNNLLVHQLNVAVLAVRIGQGLGWERATLVRLALASLVHDVGLLKVPLQVIQKEKRLSTKERALLHRHAEWGEEIIRNALGELTWLPPVIRQVHERESGTGFPDGLTGELIDPLAKVIGLADTLESLTHTRPWRPAMIAFDAIQHLMKRQAEFDPEIFRAMVKQISLFPVGSWVRLNNGSIARVVSINTGNFYRPRLEILRDGTGKKVAGSVVNLADSPLHITGPLPEDALSDPEEASR